MPTTRPRKTFEQAVRDVAVQSQIRHMAEGYRQATKWNWKDAHEADCVAADQLVVRLCEDIQAVTGRRVRIESQMARFFGTLENYTVTDVWQFYLRRLRVFVDRCVSNLRSAERWQWCSTIPLGPLEWRSETAVASLPDDMGRPVRHCLTRPAEVAVPDVRPRHIGRIIRSLAETHYEYNPFVLEGHHGNRFLAIRLGRHWNDIVVATWDPPRRLKTLNVCLLVLGLICTTATAGLAWWSTQFAGNSVYSASAQFVILIAAAGTMAGAVWSVGVLFLNSFKPLRL